MNIEYVSEREFMTSVGGLGMGLFQKTFMARKAGWMDGWMENGPDGFLPLLHNIFLLKWSRWISSLLHNTLLASPHCINVISGKQIVKRSVTI